MTLSIKGRMVIMALAALVGAAVPFAIQYTTSAEVERAIKESEVLRVDIEVLAELELKNTELVLAAMDSIIDRDEGEIQPERLALMDEVIAAMRENYPLIDRVAVQVGMAEQVRDFRNDFEAVAKAIRSDLKVAIETRAPESAYAALDDVIDESGEGIGILLGELRDVAGQRLERNLMATEHAVARAVSLGIGTFAATFIVLVILMTVITRSVTGALGRLTRTMHALAEGEIGIDVPDTGKQDEIGEMARSVEVFKENAVRLEESRRHEEQQREADRLRAERQARLAELADRFAAEMKSVVDGLSRSANDMQRASNSVQAAIRSAEQESSTVATSADSACDNVGSVAHSADELRKSISEIARQVGRSSDVAQQAVSRAVETNRTVEGLSVAADRIGAVVKLISDIAEQTNLLALNATIEAARAGEAGRGFAVVATEVKSLATETAKATEDINAQIASVQEISRDSVTAIRSIQEVIDQLNEAVGAISAAVEEQEAATAEIARNTQMAAGGTDAVSSAIGTVVQASRSANAEADRLAVSAQELGELSRSLKDEVDQFIKKFRGD
jgi:methyl-accepting chemotaxis protein